MFWKFLLIGFLYGTAVSVANHYYLQWTIKRNKHRPPDEAMAAVINCYMMRFFINMLALFLAYYFANDIWVLIGAGVGLTVMKNVTVVKEYKESKKHPWKKKNSPKKKSSS
jgi:hypothetical protein